MGGVQKRRTLIVSKLESFYGAGGGTPSGGFNSPACTPRCAVGFPPQATRYPTPHRGVGYTVRDGARGRVPTF